MSSNYHYVPYFKYIELMMILLGVLLKYELKEVGAIQSEIEVNPNNRSKTIPL